MKNKKILVLPILAILSILGLFFYLKYKPPKINGLILLSENTGDISGYYKWEKILDEKNLKAIIKPESFVLEKYPDYFRQLADKGYEIATGYGQAPFWDMPYDQQYQIMKDYKQSAEAIIGKPIRIFSSKYFAYDENTLKAADALGIPYILARGEGIKSVIYSPHEYKAKLLSVSNLVFQDMGSGSLCDASLYQRGSTADEFVQVLNQTFDENPKDLILVSHVYIGGTRIGWWDAYESALNSPKVNWRDFDIWSQKTVNLSMPYAQIPYNTEVKYIEPKPAVPVEEIELIPELKPQALTVFHNGQGPMCLEFLEFIKKIDYPIEQYLDSQSNFYQTLENYKAKFNRSQGLSTDFAYYPIIFIKDKAFSGFNQDIKQAILDEISVN